MGITLESVKKAEKEILRQLLEKYLYEFSQYSGAEINPLGLYGYDYLDNYWTEENRWPFFVKFDSHLVGFTLVNDICESGIQTNYCLSEFFVLYAYCHTGLAQKAVNQLWAQLQGTW